jgi:hypothetical protein
VLVLFRGRAVLQCLYLLSQIFRPELAANLSALAKMLEQYHGNLSGSAETCRATDEHAEDCIDQTYFLFSFQNKVLTRSYMLVTYFYCYMI